MATNRLDDLHNQLRDAEAGSPEGIRRQIEAEQQRQAREQQRQQEAAALGQIEALAGQAAEAKQEAAAAIKDLVAYLELTLPETILLLKRAHILHNQLTNALRSQLIVDSSNMVRRHHGAVRELAARMGWNYGENPMRDMAYLEPIAPPALGEIVNKIVDLGNRSR